MENPGKKHAKDDFRFQSMLNKEGNLHFDWLEALNKKYFLDLFCIIWDQKALINLWTWDSD